jgi:hypothetical protein
VSTRHELARTHKAARRTAGNVTPTSTTWADVDTALDRVLAASVGDTIEVAVSGLWGSEAQTGYLDVVTVVSAAPVNSVAAGGAVEATASTVLGVPGWRGPSGALMPIGGPVRYTVQAGDLASGYVTLRLRCAATGSKTLNASTGTPLVFAAWVRSPADPN